METIVGEALGNRNAEKGIFANGFADASSESVATFAHEIRTPLATLVATLEILERDASLDTENIQGMVARLQRGVAWITTLVDNLNTWSALRSGVLRLDRSETVVHDWIEQAMGLVQPILERRDQTMLLACPMPSPIVAGDAFRLSQVIANLLTNASRYGAWGDTIAITVIDECESVVIRVSDHGPGISAAECETIFAPGVRGHAAAHAASDGQGLGLHIVAGIIELHGGNVGVDSVLGRGTTFWIRLPPRAGS